MPAVYENSYIMWSDGSNSASRRYPANGQPGLPTNGSSHLFKANNVWIEYSEAYVPTDPPTTPPTQPPTTPANSYVIGDADGNGEVTTSDCVIMMRYILGSASIAEENMIAADVNNDNNITIADVVIVMRYLVGYTDNYNVGTEVTIGNPTEPPTTPTTPTTPPTQPPTQPPTVSSSIVYFNPSTIATGDERWAIYTWKGSSSTWLDMTGSGSLYQAALPSGYTNFIVVRMNGATTANNWNNKWNQTDNLTYSASKNYVKATGWGSGDRFTVTQSAK